MRKRIDGKRRIIPTNGGSGELGSWGNWGNWGNSGNWKIGQMGNQDSRQELLIRGIRKPGTWEIGFLLLISSVLHLGSRNRAFNCYS
jgi:hypothetical protein